MTKSILLVEDDRSLGATLSDRLHKEGLQVDWATEIRQSKDLLAKKHFDLIVLDVGLPDGSGFELAREIKCKTSTPFIFVTSQAAAEERLLGYELGADEFIPKPFHLKEMLLRVQHVLHNHSVSHRFAIGDVVIDFTAMTIATSNKATQMNLRESELLKLLIKESPRVVSRDEILDRVWGETEYPTNRTIDNVVVRLRQMLGEQVSVYLKSVRGVGYQWLERGQV